MATAVALVVVALFVALVDADSAFIYSGGFALYALATGVLINAALGKGPFARIVGFALFAWIGRVSYSVYVFHWPIQLWLDEKATGLEGAALHLLRLALTFGLAAASYIWIESPIRRRSVLRGRVALIAAPAAMAFCLAGVLSLTSNAEVPDSVHFDDWHPKPMPELGPRARYAGSSCLSGRSL